MQFNSQALKRNPQFAQAHFDTGNALLVTHRLRRPAMDETGAELIVSGTAPSAQRSGFAWCEKPVC